MFNQFWANFLWILDYFWLIFGVPFCVLICHYFFIDFVVRNYWVSYFRNLANYAKTYEKPFVFTRFSLFSDVSQRTVLTLYPSENLFIFKSNFQWKIDENPFRNQYFLRFQFWYNFCTVSALFWEGFAPLGTILSVLESPGPPSGCLLRLLGQS